MKKISGLSLIEILISVSIFSVIILSVYSAFQTGTLSYNKIDSSYNSYQTARSIFNRIESDLKNAYIYSDADSKFSGTSQSLDFFSVNDFYDKNGVRQGICRIKYDFSNPSLKRTLYQKLDATIGNPETASLVELSGDIKKITFQYALATADPDQPFIWQDAWPEQGIALQLKTLPLAVEIKLSVIQRDKQQKELGAVEFSKIVALNL